MHGCLKLLLNAGLLLRGGQGQLLLPLGDALRLLPLEPEGGQWKPCQTYCIGLKGVLEVHSSNSSSSHHHNNRRCVSEMSNVRHVA